MNVPQGFAHSLRYVSCISIMSMPSSFIQGGGGGGGGGGGLLGILKVRYLRV